MFDRKRDGAGRVGQGTGPAAARRAHRPRFEGLEERQLLTATLNPIGPIASPTTLGEQVPLFGGTTDQTYTVTSDNAAVKATVTQGKFLTVSVTHASSGATDPAFSGSLTFQLFDDITPQTTAMIESLVTQGFYTNKTFHRIANNFPGVNDFIVQGGSVNGSGGGDVNQPGFPFEDEFVQSDTFTGQGQLAMANAGPDTNGSQFFITTGSPRFLDFKHTVFGQIVSGLSVLQQLTTVPRDSKDAPLSPITITSATLSNTNPNGVVHIDTTTAPAGTVAHVTVTATETGTGSMVSRTFEVDVTPNSTNGVANVERPTVLNSIQNQVVGSGQSDIFQIPILNPSTAPVSYIIKGGRNLATSTFTDVDSTTVKSATVDANGVVTVVPQAGLAAGTVISLLVGVGLTSGGTAFSNFDTQAITLTVNGTGEVNLAPIATNGSQTVVANTPTTIQLTGNSANTNQTLTFTLLSQPTNGTITNFNATTGTFTYTPNTNFQGADTVQFQVTDVGAPTPNLTSGPATFTINVGGGITDAVRVIDRVLVITPPPRTDKGTNVINVTQSGGQLIVNVNGVIDTNQPEESDIDQIVAYGAKASDRITIGSDVAIPATINGGLGGNNVLQAGGADTTIHGWYGTNQGTGGAGNDRIIGQKGHLKAKASAGKDLVYLGEIRQRTNLHGFKFPGVSSHVTTKRNMGSPPVGTFYRFKNNRLVKVNTPKAKIIVTDNSPSIHKSNSDSSSDGTN